MGNAMRAIKWKETALAQGNEMMRATRGKEMIVAQGECNEGHEG